MTTFHKMEFKCDCCEETFIDDVIGSTSEFGYCDLDTRPASPKRYALPLWIHKCPNCGYVLQKDEPTSDLMEYVKSEEYQTSEGRNFTDETADKYYKNALILIKKNNSYGATMSFLNAAWACDDARLIDDAIACRKRFLELFNEIPKSEINKTMEIIRFDVLRRAGEFDTLLNECDPDYFDEEIMVKIAKYEIEKAKDKNTDCYTVEDVIS